MNKCKHDLKSKVMTLKNHLNCIRAADTGTCAKRWKYLFATREVLRQKEQRHEVVGLEGSLFTTFHEYLLLVKSLLVCFGAKTYK